MKSVGEEEEGIKISALTGGGGINRKDPISQIYWSAKVDKIMFQDYFFCL